MVGPWVHWVGVDGITVDRWMLWGTDEVRVDVIMVCPCQAGNHQAFYAHASLKEPLQNQ